MQNTPYHYDVNIRFAGSRVWRQMRSRISVNDRVSTQLLLVGTRFHRCSDIDQLFVCIATGVANPQSHMRGDDTIPTANGRPKIH